MEMPTAHLEWTIADRLAYKLHKSISEEKTSFAFPGTCHERRCWLRFGTTTHLCLLPAHYLPTYLPTYRPTDLPSDDVPGTMNILTIYDFQVEEEVVVVMVVVVESVLTLIMPTTD
jgi:hypothetical protein